MSGKPIRYEINSIADMARIPRDRWPAFAADLEIVVNALRATNETFSLGPEDMLDGAMIWTDDDDPGCELELRDPDHKPLCTIKAGPDA